jgi:hypothetical protein
LLRITRIGETPSQVTLKLEGRIASEWVSVAAESLSMLEQCRIVLLDFADVQYIDRHGIETPKQILKVNLRIVNCPPLIREMLNEQGC